MKDVLIDKAIVLFEEKKYSESLEFFENSLKYDENNGDFNK